MKRIAQWYRGTTRQAKIMLLLILLIIIGIITRWDFIESEVTTVFSNMFPARQTEQPGK